MAEEGADMEIADMERICEAYLRCGKKYVQFVLFGRHRGAQKRMRIAKGGPRGNVIGGIEGGVLCLFDAQEVLDWLRSAKEAAHA